MFGWFMICCVKKELIPNLSDGQSIADIYKKIDSILNAAAKDEINDESNTFISHNENHISNFFHQVKNRNNR